MKLLFGVIIGAAILVIVVALYCALIIASRSDNNENIGYRDRGEDQKFWKKQTCSRCKTGKYTYALDPKSDMCPNIHCWKNGKCPFYIPLEKPPKSSIFKRYKKTTAEKDLNIE